MAKQTGLLGKPSPAVPPGHGSAPYPTPQGEGAWGLHTLPAKENNGKNARGEGLGSPCREAQENVPRQWELSMCCLELWLPGVAVMVLHCKALP